MKILHIIISARSEGTPRLVLDLLDVKTHRQSVLILDDREKDLWEEFNTSVTGSFYFGNVISSGNLFQKYHLIKEITLKTIQKEQPDMVIAWPTGFAHIILKAASSKGITKLIAHVGNPPGENFKEKFIYSNLIFRTIYNHGAKAICCSDYLKKEYKSIIGVPKSIFFRVYNTFRFNRFNVEAISTTQKTALKCTMVATLEKHKDHNTLLQAWATVEKEIPKAELQLIGDGSLRKNIELQIRKLELKNVKLLGSRKDVPELLRSSSVFIFSTTKQEGFGTVLLEAMASKNFIIASDVPACREVLKNETYGKLFKAGDHDQLSSQLIHILKNGVDNTIVDAAYEYSRSFTPENMLNEYIAIAEKP